MDDYRAYRAKEKALRAARRNALARMERLSCRYCGRTLRAYKFDDPRERDLRFGDYADGFFCGLRCGYRYGVRAAKTDAMEEEAME